MDYMVTAADGKDYGPVTLEQLQQWKEQQRIGPDTHVRNFHTGQVLLASQVPGLFGSPALPTDWSQPPAPGAYVPQNNVRVGDGKGELLHSIARSVLAVVFFFVLHGIGLVFGVYAVIYAFQCQSKGNKYGPLAIAISLAALAAVAVGWILRVGHGSV
jgi:hypothetical protein